MNENNKNASTKGTSKLALLRQNRSIQKQEVDIEKAIDGFVSSLDTKSMLQEIQQNSAMVNLIIDKSISMEGTSYSIAQEINGFSERQAGKLYTTNVSLTLFNDDVYPQFHNQSTKEFNPIYPWQCSGGTNIYDALYRAITPVQKTQANHRLHLIITDGENGHSFHTQEEVKDLISARTKMGEHIFLLYNREYQYKDVKDYATELGIKENYAVEFNREGDGIKIIFQTIEDLLDGLRSNGVVPRDWAKAITAHAQNPLEIKAREIKYLT